jgi:hypothetical protein
MLTVVGCENVNNVGEGSVKWQVFVITFKFHHTEFIQ